VTHSPHRKPCPRCGVVREVSPSRGKSRGTCRDCYDVLTKAERALWAAAA